MKTKIFDQTLRRAVQQFRYIDSQGNYFWAPYLRNDIYIEDAKAPRGLGKTDPKTIGQAVNYIKRTYPGLNGEQIRQKLADGSLPEQSMNYKGIECSGFVYYVMSDVYQQLYDIRLSDNLSMPKEAVLNGALNYLDWPKVHKITKDEINSLQDDVPISWVVDTFKRKPANLCNVKSLTSDFSSFLVKIDDIQIGDLVQMLEITDQMPHVAIITKVDENSVEVVHSGRRDRKDLGGVQYETIPRTSTGLDCKKLNNPHQFIAVRRLKINSNSKPKPI